MSFEELKRRVCSLPPLRDWPQAITLVDQAVHREASVWDYPLIACRALGGNESAALPASAAVFCAVASIRLVDDILDEDPHGYYRILGAGRAANLALAFQAAGHLLLDDPRIPVESRSGLQSSFAQMSLATCFGQDLDTREAATEEEYWRIVECKTPPLFGEALRIGALASGAAAATADQLGRLGRLLGRFIQVSDDLTDALETPARADWKRRGNNLPILYAMTAPHPQQGEFLRLSAGVEEPAALAAAQKILLRCGAVSYCAFKLIEFSREVRDLFGGIPLHNPDPIGRLIDSHLKPLHRLLESAGVAEPATL